MAGMRGESRVVHAFDLRLGAEEFRHPARIRAMHRHPRRQRAAAAQRQPGVERRQRGAGDVQAVRDPAMQVVLAREHQRAAEHIAMAAEILSRRMHHHVGAQIERTRQQRRCKGVVADQQRAAAVRDVGQRRDIADLHSWIGRRLRPQQIDAAIARGAHRREVGRIDGHACDPALRQELRVQHAHAGVAVVWHKDARAMRQRFEQRAGRRHA
jgi:hypothetical protein